MRLCSNITLTDECLQGVTQMVPALRPREMVVAQLRLLVNTPAARPYSVSFARSCAPTLHTRAEVSSSVAEEESGV